MKTIAIFLSIFTALLLTSCFAHNPGANSAYQTTHQAEAYTSTNHGYAGGYAGEQVAPVNHVQQTQSYSDGQTEFQSHGNITAGGVNNTVTSCDEVFGCETVNLSVGVGGGSRVETCDESGCRVESVGFGMPGMGVVQHGYAAPQQAVYVEQAPYAPPPPAYQVMNAYEFSSFVQTVESSSFDDSKTKIIVDTASRVAFTSQQCLELLNLLSFENKKVDLAVILYSRVVDAKNWFLVYNTFKFDSKKAEVQERISGIQPLAY